MKKKSLVMFLAIVFFIAATPLGAIEFGVKAGANLCFFFESHYTIHATDNGASLWGFKGGIFASIPMRWFSHLQLGINHVTRGNRYYSSRNGKMKPVRFYYLEIPMLVNLSIKGKSLFFFFGPYYDLLLPLPPADSLDRPGPEIEMEHSDIGLVAGFRWRPKNVFIELQYTLGVLNNMSSQQDHKNHCAALLIGYVF
jgi:hypothetical protein